jgi:hypothetical protein
MAALSAGTATMSGTMAAIGTCGSVINDHKEKVVQIVKDGTPESESGGYGQNKLKAVGVMIALVLGAALACVLALAVFIVTF